MHTWCKEIDLKQYNPRNDIEIHYFKRRMNRYDAHIIIVFWKKEEDLAESWEYIDSFIALNIQSKIELLIERIKFAILYLQLFKRRLKEKLNKILFVQKNIFMMVFKLDYRKLVTILRREFFIWSLLRKNMKKISYMLRR